MRRQADRQANSPETDQPPFLSVLITIYSCYRITRKARCACEPADRISTCFTTRLAPEPISQHIGKLPYTGIAVAHSRIRLGPAKTPRKKARRACPLLPASRWRPAGAQSNLRPSREREALPSSGGAAAELQGRTCDIW